MRDETFLYIQAGKRSVVKVVRKRNRRGKQGVWIIRIKEEDEGGEELEKKDKEAEMRWRREMSENPRRESIVLN